MQRQNIINEVLEKVRAAAQSLAAEGVLPSEFDQSRIVVEPPRDASFGDLATNAALVLAKDARRKPRDLAEQIAEKIRGGDLIATADVAGAGFINVTLKPAAWMAVLRTVLAAGADYGRSNIGCDAPVNLEYVSANPTGPVHVGHGRGAVFGDALANLLAFAGFRVTREYYVNDSGAQIQALARSAFLRYREALGESIGPIPQGLYPGDYLKPVGAALAAEFGPTLLQMPAERWLAVVRERVVEMMMAPIRDDLAALNIRHDVFFSERSLIHGTDLVERTIEELRARGDVYEGRLAPPKGAPIEDWEDREQTLFRATKFGDDVDRPLRKSDGSYTYFASDIAYHKNKIDRGFATMIDVWGADHAGYVKRMQAAVKALSAGQAELDIKIVQLVKLLRGGEPLKMSKRAGEFVTLREVVDEVGRDAVRFMMLYRSNDAVLDFDLVKVIEQSRDNPIFYVQYGHARGRSVLRNACELFPALADPTERHYMLERAPLERLDDAGEVGLMRQLARYPALVEASALSHEPHRVAYYLYGLASDFHAHWNRGKDASYLRFIIPNDPQTSLARLALVQGVVTVLASGLSLLGVEAPEEMR
jgi:arginyl-tRNA synthetase